MPKELEHTFYGPLPENITNEMLILHTRELYVRADPLDLLEGACGSLKLLIVIQTQRISLKASVRVLRS